MMTITEISTFKQRLAAVHKRMVEACLRCGRSIDDVTLIAVSKTFPFSRLDEAYAAGQLHFGENYMQDCLAKIDEAKSLDFPFKWHFIGHLQRNKAKYFNSQFYLFHALDSLELARQLAKVSSNKGFTARILVQVNVGLETSKSGVNPSELFAFLKRLRYIDGLSVEGLMTIPPITASAEESRPYYRALSAKFRAVKEELFTHDPSFRHLSMGMSNDFEVAIEEGATYIRVGSLLFGDRAKRL